MAFLPPPPSFRPRSVRGDTGVPQECSRCSACGRGGRHPPLILVHGIRMLTRSFRALPLLVLYLFFFGWCSPPPPPLISKRNMNYKKQAVICTEVFLPGSASASVSRTQSLQSWSEFKRRRRNALVLKEPRCPDRWAWGGGRWGGVSSGLRL